MKRKTYPCNVCDTEHGLVLTAFICCKTTAEVQEAFSKDNTLSKRFKLGGVVDYLGDCAEELTDEGFLSVLDKQDLDFYFDGE